MKRILSMLLVLLLCFQLFAIPAQAAAVYVVSGIPYVDRNQSNSSHKYNGHWQYWSQGASKYNKMRDAGCRVVAQAKLLVEVGAASTDVSTFNPDIFLEWGMGNGHWPYASNNILEQTDTGTAAIQYAASKGITLRQGYVGLSGRNTASDVQTVMNYINAGYYVILHSNAHQAYVGRQASLNAGTPVILNSWSSHSSAPTSCMTYSGHTGTYFTGMYYYSSDGGKPADLGTNFYGVILNTAAWKPITVGSDNYITMQEEIGHASQLWKFTRQDDGSYTIASALTGKLLEMYNGNTAAGNLAAAASEDWGGNYQRWYFYKFGNGYIIKSKHYPEQNLVLDMFNNDSSNGSVITTYPRNNTGAQIWSVYSGNDIQLSSPTLSVTATNSDEYTRFNWEQVYGEKQFNVKIWKGTAGQGEPYYAANNVTSGWGIQLPAGQYQAYVEAQNFFQTKTSNTVSFTVASNCSHSWSSVVTPPTCQETAITTYTCKLCGETKVEQEEIQWSDWSETYPTGQDVVRVEYKIQYRYSDRKPNWSEPVTKALDYIASWPGGFNTSNSYYAQYNKTPITAGEANGKKITVSSNQVVGYLYWHWCRGSYAYGPINRAISDCYENTYPAFHAFFSTNSASGTDPNGANGGSALYYHNADCCRDSYWYFQIPVYRQTYTEQTLQYTGEQWDDWSQWSDTAVTATDDRMVQTREVYRYAGSDLAPHTWDEGVVTTPATTTSEGVRTHVCTVCGATGTSKIPKLEPSQPSNPNPPTNPTNPSQPTAPVNPFTDVPNGKYYTDPILWAYRQEITTGKTATTFEPSGPCTRGQIVTFLWRAMGEPEPASYVNPFTDVQQNAYYYKAVLWAYYAGITTGKTATTFEPKAPCTRCQVVTFLWRTMGKPSHSQNNPFTDVGNSKYYTSAVLWALESEITTGKTSTTFLPDETCTRAQIVTFLYRTLVE